MANEWMNGNKFGQKWTLKLIEEDIKLILDYLIEDTIGKKSLFISEVLAEVSTKNDINLYRQLWYHWQNILKDAIGCKSEDESDETKDRRLIVLDTIQRIDNILEGRIVSSALKMKTNTHMTIFVLKNSKRDWSDQQQLDLTSKGERVKQFDGTVQIKVLNSNKNVEIDDDGNVTKDDTKQIAENSE